ncbi:MAG: hypothetical protein MCSN_0750 [Candidatus Microsyncoccus archaeolyticus]|nr:MAG: hypothetical protein MCSN_0750 [Candidatus Parcubacteria bacterium]
MEKIKKILILLFLIFFFPFSINAATLYFSPSSGTYSINNIIQVGVYVSTPTEAMNAASGIIDFPTDKLEVVSLSKVGSIFSLWVQEPSFSNSLGTVGFEGVVFNPGFTGASGKLMTINFRAKKSGISNLSFLSGSVLANDGNGTNILSGSGVARFTFNETEKEEEIVKPILNVPLAPNITSSTHPDSSKWYNSNNVDLSWSLGTEIIAARTLLNKNSNSTPNVLYEPAVSGKMLTGLEDGIWYFHVQLKNSSGWGGISHFKVQIDTKAPDQFNINLVDGKVVETPQPKISFGTKDSLSGVDYYNIKVDNSLIIKVYEEDLNEGVYTMPILYPGEKLIIVQAFDKAGNYSSAAEEITITPLESPILTEYPKELSKNDILTIKGESKYSKVKLNIYFEKDKEVVLTKTLDTDESGSFSLISQENLSEGVYKIWAEVVDNRGLKSFPSQSINIIIKKPDFIQISSKLIEILSVAIPLLVLIIVLVFIISYSYYRFALFRKRVRKEVLEAESMIGETFDFLKQDLNDQIKLLGKTKSKRELTKEEDKIIKKLKKDVDYLEKSMKKEIEDIKKEIK